MSCPLRYCPDGAEAFQRLRRLYAERAQDIILASMHVPGTVLADFGRTHPAGPCAYPDPEERVRFWDALLQERAAVHDDSIPSAYLSEMDQGLYGGVLGGRTEFVCDTETGFISSMSAPILSDLDELESLQPDWEGEWFGRYVRQLEVFAQAAAGRFGISHFVLIDSYNLVFELVGATAAYLAAYEQPERVRQAIELAYALNVRIHDTFFAHVPLVAGGTCALGVQWLPGRAVMESVDPFHMTSVGFFERWGREPIERIFAHFDGGTLHLHGNGRHLLEAVATLRGLQVLVLGDDKGYPLAFTVLPEIRKRVGDLPLQVSTGWHEFQSALAEHRLVGGVFYQVGGVPDADAANRCMDQVREYRV